MHRQPPLGTPIPIASVGPFQQPSYVANSVTVTLRERRSDPQIPLGVSDLGSQGITGRTVGEVQSVWDLSLLFLWMVYPYVTIVLGYEIHGLG